MDVLNLLMLAVGLSMDAFAVSVCKGLAVKELKPRYLLITGVWFGGFQALMPTVGYFLGALFEEYITKFDHWIAFVLLAIIGANMLREAFSGEEEEVDNSFGFRTMLVMAIATSIDALASGITLPTLTEIPIYIAAPVIGLTTFLFSASGVKIGNVFGKRFEKGAQIAGGVILILLGVKILVEHLFFS